MMSVFSFKGVIGCMTLKAFYFFVISSTTVGAASPGCKNPDDACMPEIMQQAYKLPFMAFGIGMYWHSKDLHVL